MSADIKRLRTLIADDAHALTFQTFGQYRTALLREIDAIGAAPSPQGDAEDDWIKFGKRFAIDLNNVRAAAEMVHKGAGEGPYEALLIGIDLLAQHARLAMREREDAERWRLLCNQSIQEATDRGLFIGDMRGPGRTVKCLLGQRAIDAIDAARSTPATGESAPRAGLYRVNLRRGGRFVVRPAAEALDGLMFNFTPAWPIERGDSALYAGEWAMTIDDVGWKLGRIAWLASGDLEYIGDTQ